MLFGRVSAALGLVLVLVVGGAAGAGEAGAREAGATTGVTPGVPAGGPAVLYAPPPRNPQMSNHSTWFRAAFNPVSGTERYVNGEYSYTDFLYDDEATTYPADVARYGNNAADLAEYRMSVVPGGLAVRFTLTTLLREDSTIAVVAFDTDRDATSGSAALPTHPGLPFPGTDQVLTTWGTGGSWSRWTGTEWASTPLDVTTDLSANQITVFVPDSVAHPVGRWKATLATGLYDPATSGWLDVMSSHLSDIVNLGLRLGELPEPPTAEGSGNPSNGQNAALSAGEPSRYSHVLRFDWMRQHKSWDDVPTHGMMYRIFASRLPSVTVRPGLLFERTGNSAIDGVLSTVPLPTPATQEREGVNRGSVRAQLLSPLQPYAVYVPRSYRPGRPSKLTFSLHGKDGAYWWINDRRDGGERYKVAQLGEDRDSIVLSPAARGGDGWYVGDMEYDVFEAWNDTARHLTLDPARTAMTGLSMGGYGTYRFAALYPHLFARAAAIIPAGMRGIYIPGFSDDGTVANDWLTNVRHVPLFHVADTLSESTFYPGQAQNGVGPAAGGMQSLESLKYRYVFRSVAADHALMVINHSLPEITGWLGNHRVEPRPAHVTYTRMPSTDSKGLVHNRAYWLSGIELGDVLGDRAKGTVDAVSLGFGLTDPTTPPETPTPTLGVDAGGRPYAQHERQWSAAGRTRAQDRIIITATNIASLTIDPVAARVTCKVKLDIRSDTPIAVTLRGCKR